MATSRGSVDQPSDVNIPDIRHMGGKGSSSGPDAALTASPGRGEREDGSGSSSIPKKR